MARGVKVVPMSSWDQMVIDDIDSIMKNGAPIQRKVHGTAARLSHYLAMPICCGICCVWSATFRLLCCPLQCISNGPGYMCSNNGCTECTDECLAQYVKAVEKDFKPAHSFSNQEHISLKMIDRVFTHAHTAMCKAYGGRLYALFDYLLPYVRHMQSTKFDMTRINNPNDMRMVIGKYYS